MEGVSVTPRRVSHGYLPQSASKPLKQFDKGRICWHPSCQTKLSTYNGGGGCALHPSEPEVKRRVRPGDRRSNNT
jgi:hypothetical protein